MFGFVITTDEVQPIYRVEFEPRWPDFTQVLRDSQDTLYVERVHTPTLHDLATPESGLSQPTVIMWVDENGRETLPLNKRATCFYRWGIYGDVLLTGEGYGPTGEIDIVDMPLQVTIEAITEATKEKS